MQETGSIAWPRALLVGLFAWWTLSLGSGASTWCFLDFVNLAFHESGHLAFGPFGSTLAILGGTLGQLLVPGSLCVYFLVKERQPFAAAVCLWWFGQNFINISIYMADSRALALPLVGGGDHDWNELFYRFGLLGEDAVRRVAGLTRAFGVAGMLAGLSWTAFFILPAGPQAAVRDTLIRRFPWVDTALEV